MKYCPIFCLIYCSSLGSSLLYLCFMMHHMLSAPRLFSYMLYTCRILFGIVLLKSARPSLKKTAYIVSVLMMSSQMCRLPMPCVLMQPITSWMLAFELCVYNKLNGPPFFSLQDAASMISETNFKSWLVRPHDGFSICKEQSINIYQLCWF